MLNEHPQLARHVRSIQIDWDRLSDSNLWFFDFSTGAMMKDDGVECYYRFHPNGLVDTENDYQEQYGDAESFHWWMEGIFEILVENDAPLEEQNWVSPLFGECTCADDGACCTDDAASIFIKGIPKYVADLLLKADKLPRTVRLEVSTYSWLQGQSKMKKQVTRE